MDYKKIGLKCGIEIHQQLQTKEKLFCLCRPELAPKGAAFIEVKRKLRPVAGETGEIDRAALHETLKGKEFIYRVYPEQSCGVEIDEEPPHPLNLEALYIALTIAKLLNCMIPDEIEVMRKTVIDGSNTTGFQRTVLIGLNGWIETDFGRVGIQNVYLEEDAAQIIKKGKNRTIFGLDRLGIPLIEIGTSSNIPSPEQAKAVAEKLGMLLRSTGKVKRGIGTIRQDLNVSVKGGARVEIKGVQKLKDIPKLIENEIKRQMNLIKSGKVVTRDVRKALPNRKTKFLRPLPGSARLYPETDIPQIRITREMLSKIKLPEIIEDKIERLVKQFKLSEEIAKQIVKEGKTELFQETTKLGFDVRIVSATLVSYMKELNASEKQVKQLFHLLKKNNLTNPSKESVKELLSSKNPEAVIKKLSEKPVNLEKLIEKIIKDSPSVMKAGKPENAIMGIAMKELKGKVSGAEVMEVIKKKIKES